MLYAILCMFAVSDTFDLSGVVQNARRKYLKRRRGCSIVGAVQCDVECIKSMDTNSWPCFSLSPHFAHFVKTSYGQCCCTCIVCIYISLFIYLHSISFYIYQYLNCLSMYLCIYLCVCVGVGVCVCVCECEWVRERERERGKLFDLI